LAPFSPLTEEEQRLQGMYMIGQLAALRSEVTTIEKLHHDVAVGGSQRLQARPEEDPWIADEEASSFAAKTSQPSDIAIIGMSCILPKAPHLQAYWQNILNKVNAITEIPADRWDWKRYYDPDPSGEAS
jgi:hypothetical protein